MMVYNDVHADKRPFIIPQGLFWSRPEVSSSWLINDLAGLTAQLNHIQFVGKSK